MLMDGSDHLLVIIGDHGKDGLFASAPSLADDPVSQMGKLVRVDIETGESEVLTLGHRNPQGLARDKDGNLWATEHGPRGGDELNLLVPGGNYGWPIVSYGTKYDGRRLNNKGEIGRHDGFMRPAFAWVPSIGISSLVVNDEQAFPLWGDDLLVASLDGSSYAKEPPPGRSIFRVRRHGTEIQYVERIEIGSRIRDMAFLSDGRLALLPDTSDWVKVLRPTDRDHERKLACESERLFYTHCGRCHRLDEEVHGIGPHLVGALGRRAGTVEGYGGFSPALQSLDRIWTPADMERFIRDPQEFAPGTSKNFSSLTEEEARLIVELIGGGPDTITGFTKLAYNPDGSDMNYRIRHITPGKKYKAQIRSRAANGKVAYSEEVFGTPDGNGSMALTWDAPPPGACVVYEFRLQREDETRWRPWRRFVPSVK